MPLGLKPDAVKSYDAVMVAALACTIPPRVEVTASIVSAVLFMIAFPIAMTPAPPNLIRNQGAPRYHIFALPAPAEQTERAKAGGEERKGGGERSSWF
jgi:hypothetical protein